MQFIVLVFVVSGKDSTPGPRLAMSAVLGAVEDKCLVMMGIVCSSFVVISSGTHGRTPFMPLGNTQYESVRNGNTLASRTLGCSSYLSCFIVWFANACEALYIEDMHACIHTYRHHVWHHWVLYDRFKFGDYFGRLGSFRRHTNTSIYKRVSFLSFLPGNSLSTDLRDMDAHVGVFSKLNSTAQHRTTNTLHTFACAVHLHPVLLNNIDT